MINDNLISVMCYLCKYLEKYVIYKNRTNPKQGSLIWLLGRKKSVGCSELYNACGSQIEKQKLINSKNGDGFNISNLIPVIHGNVYESSTRLVTELVLGTKIYTMSGSIKHPNGVVSCSPDGIGVVKLPFDIAINLTTKDIDNHYSYKNDRLKINQKGLVEPAIRVENFQTTGPWQPPPDDDKDVKLVALYEFKSRYSKEMNHKSIQQDHLYQVLGGIEVMSVSYNVGVYSESWFDTGLKYTKPLAIYDHHRGTTGNIYFGSCKYIKLLNQITITMVELNLYSLRNKRVTVDYEILDGPYCFAYADKFVFHDNDFFELYPEVKHVPPPTCVEMMDVYFDQVNAILGKLENKPSMYTTYRLDQLSIKYVAGLKGFIDLVEPYCREILEQVIDQ